MVESLMNNLEIYIQAFNISLTLKLITKMFEI